MHLHTMEEFRRAQPGHGLQTFWATVGVHPDTEDMAGRFGTGYTGARRAAAARSGHPPARQGSTTLQPGRSRERAHHADLEWQRERSRATSAPLACSSNLVIHTLRSFRATPQPSCAGRTALATTPAACSALHQDGRGGARSRYGPGYYVSFSGIITLKNAGTCATWLLFSAHGPPCSIQDRQPYLAPVPYRSRETNNPSTCLRGTQQIRGHQGLPVARATSQLRAGLFPAGRVTSRRRILAWRWPPQWPDSACRRWRTSSKCRIPITGAAVADRCAAASI